MSERPKTGSLLPALALVAATLVAVLATQQAVAASIGGFVAQLWVSVLDVVLRLIGAAFGG